jgi:uncharacterized membrane protein
MGSVRRAFVRGVVTLAPLLATVGPLAWLYGAVADLPVFPDVTPVPLRVAMIGAVAVSLTLSVGYFMRTGVGRRLSGLVDRLVNTLVGVRTLYNAAKNSAETLLVDTDEHQGPVKVGGDADFRLGALRTGNRTPAGREIVFLPGAPDVSSGFVLEVDPDRLEDADESTVSLAVRLLSCGFSDGDDGDAGGRVRRASIEDLGEE